jgi:4-hydroxy-tetrahydrodipicolinate synthase
MKTRWSGCGTALVTPFTETGELDEAAIRRLAKRQIDGGVQFLVPCGTTGESPTLSHAEKLRVVELVAVEAAGKVPVLGGAGGYDTEKVVALAKDMVEAGADGILSVTPYYNKPSPEGLYRHFCAVAESVNRSIVVYNVPSRTGCNISPETLTRLASVPNIVGVKEASGNLGQMCQVCRDAAEDFCVLSGDDAYTLPMISIGAVGVISVVSNEVPLEMAALVSAALAGDFATARSTHERLLPLMQVNFVESNPIPVKAALAEMGLISARYRLPLVPPEEPSRQRIAEVLRSLGITTQQSPLRSLLDGGARPASSDGPVTSGA